MNEEEEIKLLVTYSNYMIFYGKSDIFYCWHALCLVKNVITSLFYVKPVLPEVSKTGFTHSRAFVFSQSFFLLSCSREQWIKTSVRTKICPLVFSNKFLAGPFA